jgi:peptidyl-tRNA hydrolase
MWAGLLHHVVNEHKWVLVEGKANGQCAHEELDGKEREKPSQKINLNLVKNSPNHEALRKVILKKQFLNTLPYYTNFRYLYSM